MEKLIAAAVSALIAVASTAVSLGGRVDALERSLSRIETRLDTLQVAP